MKKSSCPKITALTTEQTTHLPIFREEARAKGLRTQWASDDEMRDTVKAIYQSRNLSEPCVLIFDDPRQCLGARAILRYIFRDQLHDQLHDQLRVQLGDQLRDQLHDQLRVQLGDQFRVQLGDQLRDQLRDQLHDQLGNQLRDQLRDQLWDQLGDQLREQLCDQLWDQLGDQLRDQLLDQLRDQLDDQLDDQLGELGELRDQLSDQLGDQFWDGLWFAGGAEIFWVAFYQFAERIGVRYNTTSSAALAAWARYAETCGPLYPYDGWAFVSRRPEALAFDDQRRLHSEIGPAMRFPSGYAIHAWHGVCIPAHWIYGRANLDPVEVLRAENVEQRAAGAAIIGWPRMTKHLDMRVIDGDPNTDIGALVEFALPGLNEPGRFLMAQCPRNGTICEGVPRVSDIDHKPINTAIAAQAWRDSLSVDEYTHPALRT